jgi:hypothetical protein
VKQIERQRCGLSAEFWGELLEVTGQDGPKAVHLNQSNPLVSYPQKSQRKKNKKLNESMITRKTCRMRPTMLLFEPFSLCSQRVLCHLLRVVLTWTRKHENGSSLVLLFFELGGQFAPSGNHKVELNLCRPLPQALRRLKVIEK